MNERRTTLDSEGVTSLGHVVKRTLAIKLGALGDVALALPFLRRLAQPSPDQLAVVTTAPFVSLIEAMEIKEVVVLPARTWTSILRLGFQLRRMRFERVVDLQGNRASRWLTWLAGRQVDRVGLWPGWPYTVAPDIQRHPVIHIEPRFDATAKLLRLSEAVPIKSALPSHLSDKVRRWLEGQNLAGRKLVLMHAGCSPAWETKRWPAAHFERVARHLEAAGYAVIWLGAADERALNATLAVASGTDATGAFSLVELLALAGQACFALTNDSGPMHLLAAGGLPVYAFFGPVDASRSHASGQRDRVLERPLPCRPCYAKTCQLPGQTHDCLAELQPETVLARLQADGWLAQ